MIRDRLRSALKRVRSTAEPTPPETPEPPAPQPPAFERAALEAILDDMVRPALRDDGGDIEVLEIRGGEIAVRMIGACDGCPSQSVTLTHGVERLLAEELPGFTGLVVE